MYEYCHPRARSAVRSQSNPFLQLGSFRIPKSVEFNSGLWDFYRDEISHTDVICHSALFMLRFLYHLDKYYGGHMAKENEKSAQQINYEEQ